MGQYDPCSACGEDAVEFDCIEGVVSCESCGRVISDQELVHSAHTDATTFVAAKDSGTKAGSYFLQQNILAKSMRSSIQPIEDLTGRLNAAADHMHLPPTISSATIRAQAKNLLDNHGGKVTSRYGKDATAYAALYATIRLNKLPYTLLDVAVATRLNVFEIGKAYRALLQLSGLMVATVSPSVLFKRTISKILSLSNDEGESSDINNNNKNKKRKNTSRATIVSVSDEKILEKDASMVVDWAQGKNVSGWTGSPMLIAVSAILFAAEMNQITVPLKKVCQELLVDHLNVSRRLKKLRDRLLEVSERLLPYFKTAKVTGKNISLHAKTVIRLSIAMPGALVVVHEGVVERGGGVKTSRQVKKEKRQQAADTERQPSVSCNKRNNDGDSRSLDDDNDDDVDVDEYLRTDEEVKVYSEVLEVLEHLEHTGARR
jgi:transcription initiation factor TFIIIB Brf1 subunit/transcription initiation factor TFIIB